MNRYSVTAGGKEDVVIEAARVETHPERNQIIFFDEDGEPVGQFTGVGNFYKLSDEDSK